MNPTRRKAARNLSALAGDIPSDGRCMDDVPMAIVNPSVGHFETSTASRERSLVERARDMDPTAWDELYTLHYSAIQRYAMFRLSDAVAADDVAAEVFLEAVRGIGNTDIAASPSERGFTASRTT